MKYIVLLRKNNLMCCRKYDIDIFWWARLRQFQPAIAIRRSSGSCVSIVGYVNCAKLSHFKIPRYFAIGLKNISVEFALQSFTIVYFELPLFLSTSFPGPFPWLGGGWKRPWEGGCVSMYFLYPLIKAGVYVKAVLTSLNTPFLPISRSGFKQR